jgi:hypothetical protein
MQKQKALLKLLLWIVLLSVLVKRVFGNAMPLLLLVKSEVRREERWKLNTRNRILRDVSQSFKNKQGARV